MTHAFIINIVPLVLEESCFAGHIFNTSGKQDKKAQLRKCKAEMRKGIKGDSPPTQQI